MKKQIALVVKILIYLTFFVPLIVIPSSFIFPFIVPKIVTFRSIVIVMLAGYILLLIINWQEYRPKFTIVNLVLAAFFVSFAISTFAGVDAYHSFWDNHERMLGLFTIFHYVIYYFICTAVFKTWADWKTALRFFLIAGSVVMIIGLMQVGNPDLLLNQGNDRVASTLGNPIYVGNYGLFLAFAAFLLFIREKTPFWKWLEIIIGILGILGMFYSGTRGAMLGLGAGIIAVLIGYAIVLQKYPRTRKIIIAGLVFFVFAAGLLYVFRKTHFVSAMPAIGRTFNTSLADVKASARWIAWQIAVQSWKERPLFGWGPNNYFYAFDQHYQARSLEFGYGETWFDNAHNIIVNTLAVQGLVGLIVYLALFILAFFNLWRAYAKRSLNMHLAVVVSAFLVAHLVGNITVFEDLTSYLYFMFWLAMVNQLTNNNERQPLAETINKEDKNLINSKQAVRADKKIGYGLISTISLVAVILIFIFNIQPARANMLTLDTLRLITNDPVLAVDKMKEALAFSSPHIDDIRSDIGRTVLQKVSGSYQDLGKDRSNEILSIIYAAQKENLTLHPLDIRNQLSLSQLAQTLAMVNNNRAYIQDAEKFLEDALSKSPKRQQIIYILANTKMQLGKYSEAIKLLSNSIDDDTKISEGYWRLAYTYKSMGDAKKAVQVLVLAQKRGVAFSDSEKSIINQYIIATSSKK